MSHVATVPASTAPDSHFASASRAALKERSRISSKSRTLPIPPRNLFGTMTSVNPVWAVAAGWLVLGQVLAPNEWLGIGIIVAANVVVSARSLRPAPAEVATAA